MSAESSNDDLNRDVRIVRRNVAKGFIAPAEVQKQLDQLPDVESRGEWFDPEAGDDSEAGASAEDTAS